MPPILKSLLAGLCLTAQLAGPALAEHGALATAPDGRIGWSRDFRSQGAADRRALEECGRRCRILIQFKDTCVAYATGREGAFGWERGDSEHFAREMALEHCRRHGRDCQIRMATCT